MPFRLDPSAPGGGRVLTLYQRLILWRVAEEGPTPTADLRQTTGQRPSSVATTLTLMERRDLVTFTGSTRKGRTVAVTPAGLAAAPMTRPE